MLNNIYPTVAAALNAARKPRAGLLAQGMAPFEAANAATGIAETLPTFGEVNEEDPEAEMLMRANTTKALRIRDSLLSILASLNDDPC